jgi:Na+-transporting NADH:ubiquinone oxidoreductase subunit F
VLYLYAILLLAILGGGMAVLLLLAARYICNYGECRIKINEREPVQLQGGGKLLDALYANDIFIPSACGGQGTCGFCKVRVLHGGGSVLPTETPFLTSDELEAGTRLACQVKIRNDLDIVVKDEYLLVRRFAARVASARMLTSDIRELRLSLLAPARLDFRPGQYVQVAVPHKRETIFRAYSLASPPSMDGEIELLVRLIPGGLGSTYLHRLQVGEELSFTGPYGDFELDESVEQELVCVGGGCGMAPMRSLLRHLAEAAPQKPCWLFFGARSSDQLLYHDELQALTDIMPQLRLHFALSEPEKSPEWRGETGFIHQSAERHLQAGTARQAFLCGPPQMLAAARKVLKEKGMDDKAIFADEF